nr:CHASE3 domain-containing protein [Aureimonas sp. AU40]
MLSMSNLRMKAKIVLLFTIIAATMIAAVAVIFSGKTTLSNTMRWNDHTHDVMADVDQLTAAMVDRETGMRGFLITGAPANLDPYRAGSARFADALREAREMTADNPAQQTRLARVGELADQWTSEVAEPAIALMADPATRERAWNFEITNAGKKTMDELRAVTGEIISTEKGLLEIRQKDAASAERMIEWAIGGGLFGMIAMLVISGIMLVRATSAPLQRAVGLAQAISAGDLTQSVEITGRDEIADLQRAMNAMSGKLREIISDVIGSAQQVAAGSHQSASTAEQLSQGASEQAASTEQLGQGTVEQAASAQLLSRGISEQAASTERLSQGATEQAAATEQASAAMEEMSANIRQTAENATTTEKIAAQASVNAEKSGKAVANSVEAMRTIAGKIRIVQEIARQTDLLALNAAIEAARAGQHGKGFAVVASEVRKLAERSQQAAAEISDLSTSTLSISEEAGRMLEQLVPDIQRTSELVGEISAACREQNTGAEQINQAIQQLDKVTQQTSEAVQQLDEVAQQNAKAVQQLDEIAQQNAAAVHQLDQITQQNASASNEMSATAEQLSAEASRLTDRVAFFRLGTETEGSHRPAAPARSDVRALQAEVDRFATSRPPVVKPLAAKPLPVKLPVTKPAAAASAAPAHRALPAKRVARGGIALDLGPEDGETGFEKMSS